MQNRGGITSPLLQRKPLKHELPGPVRILRLFLAVSIVLRELRRATNHCHNPGFFKLGVIGKQRGDGCFVDPAQGEVNTVLERGSAPRTTEEN